MRFGVGVCFGADTGANHHHAGRTAAVAERDAVSIDANYQSHAVAKRNSDTDGYTDSILASVRISAASSVPYG